MTASVQSVQLAVQHVRKSCEWMPVRRMDARKGLGNSFRRQTRLDHAVFININVIIIVDEFMSDGLPENDPDCDGQKQADNGDGPRVVRTDRDAWLSLAFGMKRGTGRLF